MTDQNEFYRADTYRVGESIGFLIKNLTLTMTRELDRRMLELGLTDAQWQPLLLLQQGVGSTAADLARAGCQDTGAVTRLLDRVEAKGLIERVRSAQDRRVVNLELTEEGKRVAAEVPRIISELVNQVLAGFSHDEFDQFRDLLKRALLNAQNLGQGGAS